MALFTQMCSKVSGHICKGSYEFMLIPLTKILGIYLVFIKSKIYVFVKQEREI